MLWYKLARTCSLLIGVQGCTTLADSTDGAATLDSGQIETLYSGRTWKWDAGGAYFMPDHKILALSQDERERPGFMVGEWWATNSGLLCFSGSWRFVGGNSYAESCFRHRMVDDKVYQRKEPTGSWYIFKSEPLHPDNPFLQLVPGDRISADLEIVRTSCRSPFADCPVSFEPPPVNNPLQADEIRQLFSDRTWLWPTGGAYFGPVGWYEAWAVDQIGESGWSIGRWSATDSGLLCMEGPWTTAGETTKDERCFAFREEGGIIYQRVPPAGDWYVFKSVVPVPEDPYSNLTAGNLVDEEVNRLREM